MIEYRVEWCQKPHAYNVKQVLFVEADSADDARKIARDHIERRKGIARDEFTVYEPMAVIAPPVGRVKE